jgi:hypothetical protein
MCIANNNEWCYSTLSPYNEMVCFPKIQDSECNFKVAREPQHCENVLYDGDWVPPPPPSPNDTTTPSNDTVESDEKDDYELFVPTGDTTTAADYEDFTQFKFFNQQFLHLETTYPNFYLLFEGNQVTTYKGFVSAVLLCSLMGFLTEMLRFLKWYITIRRRVTSNCLQLMLKQVRSFTDDVNEERVELVDEYELTMAEKFSVSCFFFLHRFLQLLLAIQVMLAYHFWVVFGISLGMAVGNLIFAGLTQDQVLINRVKREIKMKKILNQKINEHNLKIQEYCMLGQKNLITHWKEPMSLQKIQLELEVVRELD